jgi:hypothetical protein
MVRARKRRQAEAALPSFDLESEADMSANNPEKKPPPYAKRVLMIEMPHSTYKLVLFAMLAHCDGASLECWPSRETICKHTLLNRKTVSSAMVWLRENGIIEDTGKRKGHTGSIIVYRLIGVKNPPDKVEADPNTGHLSGVKNGSASDAYPGGYEREAGPFVDRSRPVLDQQAGPKTGHRSKQGSKERSELHAASPLREEDTLNSNSESQSQRRIAKEQKSRDDFDLAVSIFEKYDKTSNGVANDGRTNQDLYSQIFRENILYPGAYLQGVDDKSGGISTGMEAVFDRLIGSTVPW